MKLRAIAFTGSRWLIMMKSDFVGRMVEPGWYRTSPQYLHLSSARRVVSKTSNTRMVRVAEIRDGSSYRATEVT